MNRHLQDTETQDINASRAESNAHVVKAPAMVRQDRTLNSESSESIGQALSAEARRFHTVGTRCIGGLSLAIVIAIALRNKLAEAFVANVLDPRMAAVIVMTVGISTATFIAGSSLIPRRRVRRLTAKLIERKDPRSVGPLIDALELDDRPTRESLADALILLLPAAGDNDVALNAARTGRLQRILRMPVESPLFKDVRGILLPADVRAIDLRVAILAAFEQVGNVSALPIVARLAGRQPKIDGERRIRDAAATCLTTLQLRTEQLAGSQTLLRASDAGDNTSKTLVRAAADSGDRSPNELLRATPLAPKST